MSDEYWEVDIECELYYKNFKGKNRRRKLIKSVLDMKNELIKLLETESHNKDTDQ